ncbi:MAG: hypothetical protein Q8N60_00570, partial [Candidatus Diapherotrites archaeon]|nr:hypothetical protein [Candidatus Diapherotrites archaeon]
MPEKNGKSDLEAEKAAWESYLRRIEGTPEAAPAKKQGMSSAFRNFFSKLRFWGKKEKPAVAMEAGPAVPSAAEEIGFAAETPVSANELAEEKAIEQIIKAMQKRRAEGGKPAEMIAVPEIEVRPSERIELALSELQHMAAVRKAPIAAAALPIAPAPFIAEEKAVVPEKPIEWEKPVMQAKVALLPKMAPVVGQKPIAVEKPVFGKVPAKPAVAIPVKAKPAEKVTAKAIKKIEIKPPLKKVPVQKLIVKRLKKIPLAEAAPVVRQAVEYLKVASKTRVWYDQKLRKQKVVLKKKRLQENVKLKQLKRKAKKRKLSVKETAVKTRLVKDQKPLLLRIKILEKKIGALQKIGKTRKAEEKMLVRSAKEAGVVIPRKELHPTAKGPIRLRTREELTEAVNAMRAVAEEVAAAVIRMPEAIPQQPERLSLDSEIDKAGRMAKNLETAFYKRKITADQFREKIFDYQSKLSELKIRKKLIEEEKKMAAAQGPVPMGAVGIHYTAGTPGRTGRIPYAAGTPTAWQAGIGYAARGVPPGPIPTAGITPRAARALERIMETAAARQPPASERIIERVIERPAAERETFAARPSQAIERAAPTAERTQPIPITERAPAPAPGRVVPTAAGRPTIERGQPMPTAGMAVPTAPPSAAAGKAAPTPMVEKAAAPKVVERIIEREAPERPVAEKVAQAKPVGLRRPKLRLPLRRAVGREAPAVPGVSREIEKVIERKAAGKLSKPEMDGFSEQVAKLLREYKVPEYQIAAKIEALDSGRLVGDFHKLIGLIKEQEEAKRAEMIPAASGFETATAITPRKKEEIVASEREIVKARIETTFDRLLD